MTSVQRHLALCGSSMLLMLTMNGCDQNRAPASTPVGSEVMPTQPLPVKPTVLMLNLERLAALKPMAGKSPIVFGEPPDTSYNWRFGSSEDDLMIWARYEPGWSTTEFSSVILTSGYLIESDLAAELDLAAAILGMDRSALDKKIMPTQIIEGHEVKIFDTGDFTTNGLSVHYVFEDHTGINGRNKPDLLIAISPEPYRRYAIEQAIKNEKK